MWALLIPLLSQVFGANGPLGQFFAAKNEELKAKQEYSLAVLKAQTENATAVLNSEIENTKTRLASTSQTFKQSTFWFLCVPVIVTMCPWTSKFAVDMWANFKLIPDWFQILFVSVYSSIWGLPIAKEYLGGMFKSLGNALDARREFKLEKARINRQAVFNSLRHDLFTKGMTDAQVKVIDNALDKGEQDE